MSDLLVDVQGVSKKFCRRLRRSLWYGLTDIAREVLPLGRTPPDSDRHLRTDEFWAVDDVSFQLRRGECLGLIGHNGAGKTTLLKMLNGLIRPDRGRIAIHGRVGALIALGAGFNPILTGRENIRIGCSVLGLTEGEIDAKFDEIVDFAAIGDFLDAPVQNYSSGMQVRLGFAVATAIEPDVLFLDEVLAVGDLSFRLKCMQRITTLLQHAAVILVTHQMGWVSRLATGVLLLDKGRVACHGDVAQGLVAYQSQLGTARDLAPLQPEVYVEGIQLSGFTAVPARLVSPGNIALRFTYRSSHDRPAGYICVNLHAPDGVFLGQHNSRNYPVPFHWQRGEHTVDVPLGRVALASGTYSLSLTVVGADMKSTEVAAPYCTRFQIDGHPYSTGYLELGVPDVPAPRPGAPTASDEARHAAAAAPAPLATAHAPHPPQVPPS